MPKIHWLDYPKLLSLHTGHNHLDTSLLRQGYSLLLIQLATRLDQRKLIKLAKLPSALQSVKLYL